MAATYTVGDGKDYATIQLAIDAIPGNLSGQGKQHVQVYAKAAGYAETLNLTTGFSNGSATDYIDVEAMVSHSGKRGQGIVVDCSSASNALCKIGVAYTRVHGFCFFGNPAYADPVSGIECNGSNCMVYDNIIYDIVSSYTVSGILCARVGTRVRNNIITTLHTVPKSGDVAIIITIHGTAGNEHEINNNTLVDASLVCVGFAFNSANYTNISNNYVGGYSTNKCFQDCNGSNGSVNYNISSDGTADDFGGTGNLVNKAAADCFECVVAGKENLDLRYTGACYREGQDNSALFTTDARGSLFKLWETGALVKRYQKTVGTSDQVSINGVKYV